MNTTLQFRIMNRYLLIGLSFIFISLASCSKRELELDETDPTMVKAITESLIEASATSKSEKEVLWEPGDEIAVFSGELSGKFVSTLKKKPSAGAVFKGELGLESWPEEMDIWAVYPYSEDAFFDGETITTVLPSEQIAKDGAFGKDMNLAVAHSNTSTLQFYNVGGGIRFSVTEEGIKKIIFEGLNGEIISGKVRIGFDKDGLPEIQKVSRGSQFITLLPPEGQETFEKNTWYYIVAIPGSLEKGYKLRFYKDTDYARSVYEKVVTIKRSFYRDLDKVDEGIDYEAQITHFPETHDEIESSIELTHSIGHKVQKIINYHDESISDETVENLLEEIDGVIKAVVNLEEGVCSIMQRDSIWINYLIDDDETSWEDTVQSLSNEDPLVNYVRSISGQNKSTGIAKTANYYSSSSDKTINNCGKALIMIPFYFDRQELDIPFLITCLEEAGFSHSNIDVRINSVSYGDDPMLPSWDYAFITNFTGENLSHYDFILIYTHGGTGFRAKSPKGERIEKQTSLCSGTVYSVGAVEEYIESGLFSWDDIAIFCADAGKDESGNDITDYFLAMTPGFLKDSHFDNTCVMLSACNSAAILDNAKGGSMVKTFIEKGAGIVYGYRKSVSSDYLNIPMTKRIIEFISFGFSFQDAVKSYKESSLSIERHQTWKDIFEANYKEWGWTKKKLKSRVAGLDPEISYYKTNQAVSGPYYLMDPFPHLNLADLTSSLGKVLFTWNCNLQPFRDVINYVENQDGEPDYTRYSVHYDVYVDGSRLGKTLYTDDTDKKASWTPSSTGEHTWYVVANIKEGNSVIASYQSDEGRFYVTGEIITVESVSLDKSNLELNVGNTATLNVTILPETATNKSVTWTSSNTSVATVSSSGEVKGIAKGTATITVKTEDGGKTATCKVTVKETTMGGDIEGTEEDPWN